MPDPKKLEVLASVGFTIRHVCATCSYFRPGTQATGWGTCRLTLYEHGKHGRREASVRLDGHCPRYTERALARSDLRASGFERYAVEGVDG